MTGESRRVRPVARAPRVRGDAGHSLCVVVSPWLQVLCPILCALCEPSQY